MNWNVCSGRLALMLGLLMSATSLNGCDGSSGASSIHVQKADHGLIHFHTRVPHIVIGPGATARGESSFEREVKLYVSDRATVATSRERRQFLSAAIRRPTDLDHSAPHPMRKNFKETCL